MVWHRTTSPVTADSVSTWSASPRQQIQTSQLLVWQVDDLTPRTGVIVVVDNVAHGLFHTKNRCKFQLTVWHMELSHIGNRMQMSQLIVWHVDYLTMETGANVTADSVTQVPSRMDNRCNCHRWQLVGALSPVNFKGFTSDWEQTSIHLQVILRTSHWTTISLKSTELVWTQIWHKTYMHRHQTNKNQRNSPFDIAPLNIFFFFKLGGTRCYRRPFCPIYQYQVFLKK